MEEGRQVGPVRGEVLRKFFQEGTVERATLVWSEGMADWQPYAEVQSYLPPPHAEAVCAECGQTFDTRDLVTFGTVQVCTGCKHAFVQKTVQRAGSGATPTPPLVPSSTNRKLLIASVGLLTLIGLKGAVNFALMFAKAGAWSGPFSTGTFLGAFIWFGLAACQWWNGGRWGLGIGIFALVVMVGQLVFVHIAASSGRLQMDTNALLRLLWHPVLPFTALAIVNFLLCTSRRERTR